jgi:hypothetical protein
MASISATTAFPADGFNSPTTTEAPSLANSSAASLPMPDPAPVMIATLFASLIIMNKFT